MRICNYKKHKDHLLLKTGKGKIKLEPFTDSIVRIVYTLEDDFSPKDSLIVRRDAKKELAYDVMESEDEIKFYTKNLQIVINKETGAFIYMDRNGQILVKEPEHGGKLLDPIDVEKTVFEQDVQIKTEQSAD